MQKLNVPNQKIKSDTYHKLHPAVSNRGAGIGNPAKSKEMFTLLFKVSITLHQKCRSLT